MYKELNSLPIGMGLIQLQNSSTRPRLYLPGEYDIPGDGFISVIARLTGRQARENNRKNLAYSGAVSMRRGERV